MSLTSLLKDSALKAKFRAHFPRPKASIDGAILAPRTGRHPMLIGTAFDYLLRFHVKRVFPSANDRRWIAEEAVDRIKYASGRYAYVDGIVRPLDMGVPVDDQFPDAKKMVMFPNQKKQNTRLLPGDVFIQDDAKLEAIGLAEAVIADAREQYGSFIRDGVLADGLARAALMLGKLDSFYRAEYMDDNTFNADYDGVDDDIADLKGLFGVAVDSGLFRPKRSADLNPDFGKGSSLVGGADADLMLDGTLVDIKTVKDLSFTQNMYNQLLGYYALSTVERNLEISSVGIYFSRYGIMHTIPTDDMEEAADTIVGWFREHVDGISHARGLRRRQKLR